jgi:hypothetical protein
MLAIIVSWWQVGYHREATRTDYPRRLSNSIYGKSANVAAACRYTQAQQLAAVRDRKQKATSWWTKADVPRRRRNVAPHQLQSPSQNDTTCKIKEILRRPFILNPTAAMARSEMGWKCAFTAPVTKRLRLDGINDKTSCQGLLSPLPTWSAKIVEERRVSTAVTVGSRCGYQYCARCENWWQDTTIFYQFSNGLLQKIH